MQTRRVNIVVLPLYAAPPKQWAAIPQDQYLLASWDTNPYMAVENVFRLMVKDPENVMEKFWAS